MRTIAQNPFRLDSPRPTIPLQGLCVQRDTLLVPRQTHGRDEAASLLAAAQTAVVEKYRQYEDLAMRDGSRFQVGGAAAKSLA